MEKIKLGMVGGGEGAFIGEVHRIAARMDERFQLCAGALCSDPERSLKSALDLGLNRVQILKSALDQNTMLRHKVEIFHPFWRLYDGLHL